MPVEHPPATKANNPVSPQFLSALQTHLTTYIGANASIVIEEALVSQPNSTPMQLIKQLCSKIPDRQMANRFSRSALFLILEED